MACGSNGACGCSGSTLVGYGGCNDSCPSVQIFDWLPKSSKDPGRDQCDLVQVVFKGRRRKIYRNKRHLPLRAGDDVIVSEQRGLDYGQVSLTGELLHLHAKEHLNYHQILRLASSNDRNIHLKNQASEKDALVTARKIVRKKQVKLKVVDSEWQFDRKRLSIFYTSSQKKLPLGPVIGDLRKHFKTRVDFRRLRPREETARIGGLGVCGRELCCSSWMRQMPPVSIHSARKTQSYISEEQLLGRCGQLKCCLNYELEHYMETLKSFPRKHSRVSTANGIGKVLDRNIFSRTVRVRLDKSFVEEFTLEEIEYPVKKQRT